MLKNTLLIAAAFALLAPGCVMEEDLDTDIHASHAWGNYHWARTSNPATLTLGDNLDSNWDTYLVDAQNDWNQSNKLSLSIVNGATKPRRCSPATGKIEVCNASYGNTGWLGIAGIYADSNSHITKGYVKLNDTYYSSPTYDTPEWRRLVTCQEVGHEFGLGHQDINFDNPNLKTCMDYTSSPGTNQHPNSHDYQLLSDIYTHLDSYNTAVAPGGAVDQAVDQDNWGELVRVSENGLKETYMRVVDKDTTLITDVLWAPDAHKPVDADGYNHDH